MSPPALSVSAARAIVLDAQNVDLHPGLMFDAWAHLKEARGDGIARPHILQPAHLVRRPAQPGTVDLIDAARARVSARIRSMRSPHTGGDAA